MLYKTHGALLPRRNKNKLLDSGDVMKMIKMVAIQGLSNESNKVTQTVCVRDAGVAQAASN